MIEIKFTIIFIIFIIEANCQFYRGELEPHYSRKTPFRLQSDIPKPVFGIGHGNQGFGANDRDHFFVDGPLRRERERSGISREDGRNSMENGDDEHYRFGDKRRNKFGRDGSPRFEEEQHPFDRDFKRPPLPDSREIRERFDRERERDNKSNRKPPPPPDEDRQEKRGTGRPERREPERSDEQMENEPERRVGRPHRNEQKSYEEDENNREEPVRNRPNKKDRENSDEAVEEENEKRNRPRERFEEPNDSKNKISSPSPPTQEQNESGEHVISKKPGKATKIVGLNMQMVGGLFPRRSNQPQVENIDQKAKNSFFRGPQRHNNEHGQDNSREQREPDQQQQQQQQPAGTPPPPQIPPFPAFPKFPGFAGFQPFQPDFPTRQFGGTGSAPSGAWGGPARPAQRDDDEDEPEQRHNETPRRQRRPEQSSREHAEQDERRPREDRRGVHESNEASPSPAVESPSNGVAERSDRRTDRGALIGKTGRNERERHEEKDDQIVNQEFPTPGRFVANIRAKKSGDLEPTVESSPITTTTATTTTTTTDLSTTEEATATTTNMPTTLAGGIGTTASIYLPTEAIRTSEAYFKGSKVLDKV